MFYAIIACELNGIMRWAFSLWVVQKLTVNYKYLSKSV